MFRLIKQVFIVLLSFSRSLATECVSLNNERCRNSASLIDLNPVELNYYQIMIILDKCDGSCNGVDELSIKIKICFSSETKGVNIKVFNIVTKVNGKKIIVGILPHVFVKIVGI